MSEAICGTAPSTRMSLRSSGLPGGVPGLVRSLASALEIHRDRVAAAHHDADAFGCFRPIAAREQRREGGGTAGLGDDADHVPECALRCTNRIIADQYDTIDAVPRDEKPQLSDPPRRQRVGRDAAGLGIDEATSRER